ncbi:MAG: methylmalonyl-CoA mutase family protein, partial [Anaerolineae bacterium]
MTSVAEKQETPAVADDQAADAASLAHATSPSTDAASPYEPVNKVRVVTAASLFDGHDAAINIMRRILQATGAEVIHLGHDRSVKDIVDAAIEEDAQGIAVSSYQGGHMEFFRYMIDLLAERGCEHIQVFGGGGGTIIPEEIRELEEYGVERIYHPEDGRHMGLQGMIDDVMQRCDHDLATESGPLAEPLAAPRALTPDDVPALARAITYAEAAADPETSTARRDEIRTALAQLAGDGNAPVVGITGTGGAGKSSFTDELVRRYVADFPEARVAVLSVDPTKKRTGGALLGDRIRMNALRSDRVYMRSLATRSASGAISGALADAIDLVRSIGYDLVLVETTGIGQADSSIVDLADVSIYVMTPEFGAQTQLEKIEMIDMADMVVINKFDKPGAHDALRDVRKAYQRAHGRFDEAPEDMPVYPTMANQFNDRGCNQMYVALLESLAECCGHPSSGRYTDTLPVGEPDRAVIIPSRRVQYLAEVAETVRAYKAHAREQAEIAAELWALRRAVAHFTGWPEGHGRALEPFTLEQLAEASDHLEPLMQEFNALLERLDERSLELLLSWPEVKRSYAVDGSSYEVRGKTIEVENYRESLAHQRIPKVALPEFEDWGNQLRWMLLENAPGRFPYTAGVFPYKRTGEDPTRMFAGEGGPWRTNKRFHYLSRHSDAKRLSTAFDSVTLYGEDPDRRPDIWGKVGNSGVSIATVEDIEALYAGFDLTDPRTSVSMTINGPAPTMLAFYFNAAVRQSLRKQLKAEGLIEISDEECLQPSGGGYSFRDLRAMVDDETYDQIVRDTVCRVRGTVQADILKEDQAQNTCIFSTEFALKMMGDVQEWFTAHDVRNFYSVSISGYHIAEAGANPIT